MSFIDINSRLRQFDSISFWERVELLYIDYTRFTASDIMSLAEILFNCEGLDTDSIVYKLVNTIRILTFSK